SHSSASATAGARSPWRRARRLRTVRRARATACRTPRWCATTAAPPRCTARPPAPLSTCCSAARRTRGTKRMWWHCATAGRTFSPSTISPATPHPARSPITRVRPSRASACAASPSSSSAPTATSASAPTTRTSPPSPATSSTGSHRRLEAAPAAPPPPRTPPAALLRRERPRPQSTRSSLTREAGGRGAASRVEGKGRRGAPAHARSSGVEGKGGRASPAHARSSRGQGRGAVHRHRSPPFGYHGTMPRENSAGQEKTLRLSNVWRESRELLAAHRGPLAIGFILMVVNRLTGLVLPASSKFAIDNVLAENRADLLLPLALVVAAATLVQAATGFALAQVVSIAGQRAIANMRRAVQAHVLRLPVRYYDSTKTGVLISRVMTDAEGIRNLVGTGIVQLVGGLFTAVIALGILFYLNWQLTVLTLAVLLTFAGVLVYGFNRLRPIFRKRGEITAEVTGRLAEAFGGNRVVKVYTAERREERIFTKG